MLSSLRLNSSIQVYICAYTHASDICVLTFAPHGSAATTAIRTWPWSTGRLLSNASLRYACWAYLPCCCWERRTLCSWNLSLTRCCVAIHLATQRLMQPFSLVDRAFDVKSLTQESKQCSTRPP